MKVIETGFKDLWVIEPKVFGDSRGYFFEAFNAMEFKRNTELAPEFVQQNQSKSGKNVLRGMHLQVGSAAQAKLVRIIQGSVLDVVVDLRKEEPTFGQYYAIELNAENQKSLFVPRGMAHGFLTLKDETIFTYSCDNYYNKEAERTLNYADPVVAISWPNVGSPILSDKDQRGLSFNETVISLDEY